MGFDHGIFQSAPVKDAPVNLVMFLIRDIEPGGIDIERVRIFHGELAHANQAGFRPRLIAELGLNLVPDLGKLFIAAQLFAGNIGHDLFVGHAQAQIPSTTVLKAKQVIAHHRPAPAGLPQFARMHGRQIKLLPNLVHLVAHDIDDPQERTLPQKKIRINTGSQLANVSGPHQIFVTGNLGICRRFAQRRNKEL